LGLVSVPDRLILFDIDGTLLSAGGAPRRAFRRALAEHFGTEGAVASDDFSGKTDPQIVYDLMRAAGFADDHIEERIAGFFAYYLEELERELAVETRHRLYPGVAELLPALAADPRVALGLLTGNIEAGARLKLAHFGLWELFSLGAYGSDDRTRDRLGPVALARAEARFGRPFRGDEAVVVGDTPADVRCARAIGAVAVAVATGRPTRETLEATGPDVLLDSLADWPAFHDSLTGPAAAAGRRPWNKSAF
jgi:phosphoglycolate phosphatase-like HAD superfamily hydrolase